MKFERGVIPAAIERATSGKIKVSWKPTSSDGMATDASDEYDTVLVAIGRTALTAECNVAAAGIEVHPSSKKIIGTGKGVGLTEQSNVDNIFAIGDVLEGYPELTPVAIQVRRGDVLGDFVLGILLSSSSDEERFCLTGGR